MLILCCSKLQECKHHLEVRFSLTAKYLHSSRTTSKKHGGNATYYSHTLGSSLADAKASELFPTKICRLFNIRVSQRRSGAILPV